MAVPIPYIASKSKENVSAKENSEKTKNAENTPIRALNRLFDGCNFRIFAVAIFREKCYGVCILEAVVRMEERFQKFKMIQIAWLWFRN